MSKPIKKGDYVKVQNQHSTFYGHVIAKKPVEGVMMYAVRTDNDNVFENLYVTQLSHSVKENDDE